MDKKEIFYEKVYEKLKFRANDYEGCVHEINLEGPIVFIGDLHGDPISLNIINQYNEKHQYHKVFLGDFIDGTYDFTILNTIFNDFMEDNNNKKKKKVYLIRGNHENKFIQNEGSFYKHLEAKEGFSSIINVLKRIFKLLPLCIHIKNRKIFCVHGGTGFLTKQYISYENKLRVKKVINAFRQIMFPEDDDSYDDPFYDDVTPELKLKIFLKLSGGKKKKKTATDKEMDDFFKELKGKVHRPLSIDMLKKIPLNSITHGELKEKLMDKSKEGRRAIRAEYNFNIFTRESLLWSDIYINKYEKLDGMRVGIRGGNIVRYDETVTKKFLDKNNLNYIIKAHQSSLTIMKDNNNNVKHYLGYGVFHNNTVILLHSSYNYFKDLNYKTEHGAFGVFKPSLIDQHSFEIHLLDRNKTVHLGSIKNKKLKKFEFIKNFTNVNVAGKEGYCKICNNKASYYCCREGHYCSVYHQEKDWKNHKIICLKI